MAAHALKLKGDRNVEVLTSFAKRAGFRTVKEWLDAAMVSKAELAACQTKPPAEWGSAEVGAMTLLACTAELPPTFFLERFGFFATFEKDPMRAVPPPPESGVDLREEARPKRHRRPTDVVKVRLSIAPPPKVKPKVSRPEPSPPEVVTVIPSEPEPAPAPAVENPEALLQAMQAAPSSPRPYDPTTGTGHPYVRKRSKDRPSEPSQP